eukprot:TRINITY_DN66966_c11_g2_i1.p1 TRINITY_DN66966_c11_g2~~TRINITY_DN66966_c11_g2_i1.p1  ORF type:complete len:563 (+),score=310.56 TRINITY_DN66966_c11_g2_i1:45-1733(+)
MSKKRKPEASQQRQRRRGVKRRQRAGLFRDEFIQGQSGSDGDDDAALRFGEADGDSDDGLLRLGHGDGSDDDSGAGGGDDGQQRRARETAEEARIRMARQMLDRIGAEEDERRGGGSDSDEESSRSKADGGDEDDEVYEDGVYRRRSIMPGHKQGDASFQLDMDPVARRLQEEALRAKGVLRKPLAALLRAKLSRSEDDVDTADAADDDYDDEAKKSSRVRVTRGHQKTATCVCLSEDDQLAYTGSKDGSIFQWDVETGKRAWAFGFGPGYWRRADTPARPSGKRFGVASVAVSSDGKMVVAGGEDKLVRVYDTRIGQQCALVHSFKGHQDAVTAVTFRRNTHQVYSGSADRTVRVWDADRRTYVETLFGHQSSITAIDSLFAERALTSGEDGTTRQWKIAEEKQLLYKYTPTTSIDCLRMLTEQRWFTGAQDGSVRMWASNKKRPVATQPNAHHGQWITSVAAKVFSDVLASGSSDGFVRVWQYDEADEKSGHKKRKKGGGGGGGHRLLPIESLPLKGFVNGLAFGSDARFLVAAVGQEHRLGRWSRVRGAKNGFAILKLY